MFPSILFYNPFIRLFTHHIRDKLAAFRWWYPSGGHWLDGRPSSSLYVEIN